MSAIAIFPDQYLRGGLRTVPGPLSQSLGQSAECRDPVCHAIVRGPFQNVADLAFQGTIILSGSAL